MILFYQVLCYSGLILIGLNQFILEGNEDNWNSFTGQPAPGIKIKPQASPT
jgi:hypothetical protein